MIGSGTRLCENLLAPGKDKEQFVIFDNYSNFEFFGENPEGYVPKEQLSLYEKLFMSRISLAVTAKELGDEKILNRTNELLKNDIATLPKKSVDVQEHAMKLDEILKTDYYWQELSDKFLNVLDSVVRPLMKRHQTTFVQDRAMQFEITVIQLEVLELERLILQQRQIATTQQDKKIELVKNKIRKSVFHLRENINKVKEKIETINKVKSQNFGTPFNYDELETVKDELAPIMQYRQRSIINDDIIEIDISDDIEIDEELQINLFSSFGEGFKYNIEQFLNRIASENIVLQKIKRGQKTTEQDIQSLVSIVLEQNPHFTLKQLEKLYPNKAQDIDLLIRSIIGVDEDEVHSLSLIHI